jgi:ABC-type antimicrobial peptide transport system permease subunit
MELAILAALSLVVGIPLGVWVNEQFIKSFTTEAWSFRAVMPWWVHVVTVAIVYALVGLSSLIAMRHLARLDLAQATKAQE